MPEPRFSIITDNPERALSDALRCAMSNKPSFVTIVSYPAIIDRLVDGTKCTGLFYARRSPALSAFRTRRMFGGLVWLDDADRDWIKYWVKLHLAANLERAMRYPDEIRDPEPEPGESVIARNPAPELETLILTQRWT